MKGFEHCVSFSQHQTAMWFYSLQSWNLARLFSAKAAALPSDAQSCRNTFAYGCMKFRRRNNDCCRCTCIRLRCSRRSRPSSTAGSLRRGTRSHLRRNHMSGWHDIHHYSWHDNNHGWRDKSPSASMVCNAEHMFALNKFCKVFSGKVFLYRNGFQPFVYRDPLHKPTITQRPPSETVYSKCTVIQLNT